jgi:hypothetical protein
MKRKTLAFVCFAGAAACVAWIATGAHEAGERPRSPAERLLGPIADLAATIQWVRVDEAENDGRLALAQQRAAIALEISPGDPGGWIYYAEHLVYNRASPLREPDRVARERWVRAGLALLERGERESRMPGRVAFARGAVYLSLASLDDADRPLPITRVEAWTAAAEAFEKAARFGEPIAAEAAAHARGEAAEEERARGGR